MWHQDIVGSEEVLVELELPMDPRHLALRFVKCLQGILVLVGCRTGRCPSTLGCYRGFGE